MDWTVFKIAAVWGGRALRPGPSSFASAAALLLLLAAPCRAGWFLDLESGAVFPGYNDVQIPREGGTRFSLSEDLRTDPAAFVRARVGVIAGEKHHLSAFAAPLRLSAGGVVDE